MEQKSVSQQQRGQADWATGESGEPGHPSTGQPVPVVRGQTSIVSWLATGGSTIEAAKNSNMDVDEGNEEGEEVEDEEDDDSGDEEDESGEEGMESEEESEHDGDDKHVRKRRPPSGSSNMPKRKVARKISAPAFVLVKPYKMYGLCDHTGVVFCGVCGWALDKNIPENLEVHLITEHHHLHCRSKHGRANTTRG